MTYQEALQRIKDAVDAGKDVRESDVYRIYKDSAGQYVVVCDLNCYTTLLHGRPGTEYEHAPNVWVAKVTIDGQPLLENTND